MCIQRIKTYKQNIICRKFKTKIKTVVKTQILPVFCEISYSDEDCNPGEFDIDGPEDCELDEGIGPTMRSGSYMNEENTSRTSNHTDANKKNKITLGAMKRMKGETSS